MLPGSQAKKARTSRACWFTGGRSQRGVGLLLFPASGQRLTATHHTPRDSPFAPLDRDPQTQPIPLHARLPLSPAPNSQRPRFTSTGWLTERRKTGPIHRALAVWRGCRFPFRVEPPRASRHDLSIQGKGACAFRQSDHPGEDSRFLLPRRSHIAAERASARRCPRCALAALSGRQVVRALGASASGSNRGHGHRAPVQAPDPHGASPPGPQGRGAGQAENPFDRLQEEDVYFRVALVPVACYASSRCCVGRGLVTERPE